MISTWQRQTLEHRYEIATKKGHLTCRLQKPKFLHKENCSLSFSIASRNNLEIWCFNFPTLMQIHQMDILDIPTPLEHKTQPWAGFRHSAVVSADGGPLWPNMARWSLKSRYEVRRLESGASFDMSCCRKHSYQKGSRMVPWFQVSSALELLAGASVMSLTRVTLVTVRTNQLLVAPRQEHGQNATHRQWTIDLESWEGVATLIWTLSMCRSIGMTDVTRGCWRLFFHGQGCLWGHLHTCAATVTGQLVFFGETCCLECRHEASLFEIKQHVALNLGSVRFFCMNDLGFGQCDAPTLGSGVGVTALSAGYGHSCILDTQGAVLQCLPWIVPMASNIKASLSSYTVSFNIFYILQYNQKMKVDLHFQSYMINFDFALILPIIQCMASILVSRSPPLLWGQHLRPMRRADWIGLHHRGLHSSRISAQLRSHSARCASMLRWQQWLAMNFKWMSCQPFWLQP